MKKLRLKRGWKVVITLILIHISFFIWKQTGILGSLAQHDTGYLVLTILAWGYLTLGQTMIFGSLWEK